MIPTLGYKKVEKVMLHEFDFRNPRNLICPSCDLAGKERKRERRKRGREERQQVHYSSKTERKIDPIDQAALRAKV